MPSLEHFQNYLSHMAAEPETAANKEQREEAGGREGISLSLSLSLSVCLSNLAKEIIKEKFSHIFRQKEQDERERGSTKKR